MRSITKRIAGLGIVVCLMVLAIATTSSAQFTLPDSNANGPTMGYQGSTPPNVYTVGPRGDYADIQAAVNAVTEPDSVVLIQPGSYYRFGVGAAVPGGLLVTGDGTGLVHIEVFSPFTGGIHVGDRGPGQTVEIRGIGVTTDDPGQAVTVSDCVAHVVLSDLDVLAYSYPPGGIDVINCTSVTVQRCHVRGITAFGAVASDVILLDSNFLNGGYTIETGSTARVCEVLGTPTVDASSTRIPVFGVVPDLWTQRVVNVGGNFEYYLQAYPWAAWYMFLSTDIGRVESSNPLVTLVGLFDESKATLLTAGMTGPTGHSFRSDAFPDDPSLLGFRGVMQYLAFNPAGAYRWSNMESFVVMP